MTLKVWPKSIFHHLTSPLLGAVLASFLLLILYLTTVFFIVRDNARESVKAIVQRDAESTEVRISELLVGLQGLYTFFRASRDVEPEEFLIFCTEMKRSRPILQSVAWIPPLSTDRKSPMFFPSDSILSSKLQEAAKRITELELRNRSAGFIALNSDEGLFYTSPSSSDGLFLLTVRLRDLLPKIPETRHYHVTLQVKENNDSLQTIYRNISTDSNAAEALEFSTAVRFGALDLEWIYAARLPYSPKREDWLLFSGAFVFALIGGIAVLFRLRLRADRLFRVEQDLRSQRMELIGSLVGGISHDFKNVLAGIEGTLFLIRDMTEEETATGEELNRLLSLMERATNRGTEIVSRLLSFTKPAQSPMQETNLLHVLNEVFALIQGTAGQNVKIEIETDHIEGPAQVIGNEPQLEQVFMNLAVNAAHAMTIMQPDDRKRGGVLRMEVDRYAPNRRFARRHSLRDPKQQFWKITITDTGVGMNSKTMDKLFTPYFTTKPEGQGSGLGLSSTYFVVKAHHGYIEVNSTKGKGTTFFVFLPCYYDKESSPTLRPKNPSSEASRG